MGSHHPDHGMAPRHGHGRVSHIEATAARLAAGESIRQEILRFLAGGPTTTRHIAANIHLGYSNTTYHLRQLHTAGAITKGRFTPGVGREWMLA